VFIGLYETPIFAKRGWLKEMANLPPDYDLDDVFKSIRDGLSYQGKLYALPFYGESSMLMYRKDLLEAKGLTMPEQPTYDDIKKFAERLRLSEPSNRPAIKNSVDLKSRTGSCCEFQSRPSHPGQEL
jgi:ABC-type glycerol-3-phosphate transport system substrate-binding protein